MSTMSRQISKIRKGENRSVITKKRRFNSILFFDSELKKIDSYLNENDVILEGEKIYLELLEVTIEICLKFILLIIAQYI